MIQAVPRVFAGTSCTPVEGLALLAEVCAVGCVAAGQLQCIRAGAQWNFSALDAGFPAGLGFNTPRACERGEMLLRGVAAGPADCSWDTTLKLQSDVARLIDDSCCTGMSEQTVLGEPLAWSAVPCVCTCSRSGPFLLHVLGAMLTRVSIAWGQPFHASSMRSIASSLRQPTAVKGVLRVPGRRAPTNGCQQLEVEGIELCAFCPQASSSPSRESLTMHWTLRV